MSDTFLVILAVVFVLGVAINIHEFGHFIVAKLLGMRVEAYSFFGLGPRIWGVKIGHTDYRVSAIPLGAFVKLYGDEATSSLEGGASEGDEVPKEELYELRPRWQKFLVMLGGPFMNIVLALAIPFVGAMMNGVPAITTPTVGTIVSGGAAETAGIQKGDLVTVFAGKANPSWEDIRMESLISPEKDLPMTVERGGKPVELTIRPTKGEERGNTVGVIGFEPSQIVVARSFEAGSPAETGGMKKGDRVVSVNGVTINGIEDFRSILQTTAGATVDVGILRGGEHLSLKITPIKPGEKYIIAAQLSDQSMERRPTSVVGAAGFAASINWKMIELTGKVFGQLFSGQRSVKDSGLSGPVGIVGQIAQTFREDGFAGLIPMLMIISLNLGVMNLLPIPLLDGGQIMVLGIEKFLSFFGKTLSMAVKEKIQLTGLAVILLLMVFVMYLDLSKFFK